MISTRIILLLLCFSLSPLLLGQEANVEPAGNNLIVIGVANELEHEEWRDYRIGFGVRALIAQLLFESGKFNTLEENCEIKAKIDDLSKRIWALGIENHDFPEDTKEARLLEADYAAYGRIFDFEKKPISKWGLGVFHRYDRKIAIDIEVTLENLETGKKIIAQGKGQAKTHASSAFFKILDDRVMFDETNIGKATKDAIEDAVDKLLNKLDKNEWQANN